MPIKQLFANIDLMQSTKKSSGSRAPWLLKIITPLFSLRYKKLQKPGLKPIFILSTGRTGTTFLADFLHQYGNITAVHEPKPSRILRMWSMACLEGRVSPNYMAAAFSKKRQKLLNHVHAPIYIESNPFIVGFVDVLKELFDDPIIIHVVRDPRTYTTSSINHGNTVGLKSFFNKYVPFWVYTPKGHKQSQLEPAFRAAEHWQITNQTLRDYGKSNKNYYMFKFEEVFVGDREKLGDLLKIIGAPKNALNEFKNSKVPRNKSKHRQIKAWQDWPEPTRQQIKKICGPLMKTYGYGKEKDW